MIRPRFAKLPPEQQEAILRAALTEFAAYGFADASLNRIIAAAGISKGSLYYYFDDKADLYAHLVRRELAGLTEREGPFEVPAGSDADGFWDTLADYYLRLVRALLAAPESAALIRGWTAAASAPALLDLQQEVEQSALPWFLRLIESGQRVGAVRTDLPADLLVAVAFGMGQAMDLWLLGSTGADAAGSDSARSGGPAVADAVPMLIGMIRRALQP